MKQHIQSTKISIEPQNPLLAAVLVKDGNRPAEGSRATAANRKRTCRLRRGSAGKAIGGTEVGKGGKRQKKENTLWFRYFRLTLHIKVKYRIYKAKN